MLAPVPSNPRSGVRAFQAEEAQDSPQPSAADFCHHDDPITVILPLFCRPATAKKQKQAAAAKKLQRAAAANTREQAAAAQDPKQAADAKKREQAAAAAISAERKAKSDTMLEKNTALASEIRSEDEPSCGQTPVATIA